jgi:hypothetical protein
MMSALGQVRVGQQTLKHTAAQGCSVPHPDLYRQLGREGQKRGRLRIERLEQRLGLFEIGRVKAFGEPAVDRRERIAGLVAPPLFAQQAGEADMLTRTLRGLERDGIVTRTILPTSPPQVEYSLTELGHSMSEPVLAFGQWVRGHLAEFEAARVQYDQRSAVL